MRSDQAPRTPRRRATVPTVAAGARRMLLELARAHGLAPDAAASAVERACSAAGGEPWTTPDAAARRALLDALRRDPACSPPPLGDPKRLDGGAFADGAAVDWDEVPAGERAVLAGALFDGLDLVGLARALGTHRVDVKARARRALSHLTDDRAAGSGLAAVRHMMAGEYALGLVPPDAFAPFQRGLALDAGLQQLVAGWDARFAPALAPAAGNEGEVTVPLRHRARAPIAAALVVLAVGAVGAVTWFAQGEGLALHSRDVASSTLPALRPAAAATLEPVQAAARPAPKRLAAAAADLDVAARAPAPPRAAAAPAARRAVAGPVEAAPLDVTVYLHHREASGAVAERAAELAGRLRGLGAVVELVDNSGLTVTADRLRFFFPADADAATRLADALAPLALQDFTHYHPRPHPGTLELWLANTAAH